MDATADELAGVVDLFGGLTRDELERALAEAAYRDDGQSLDEEAFDAVLEAALESFAIVRFERTGEEAHGVEPLYVAGPTAFPSTPATADDLPHILGIAPRTLDRDALGEQTLTRFRRAVEAAVEAGNGERMRDLLETSYDLESWAPVDVSSERERLDGALE